MLARLFIVLALGAGCADVDLPGQFAAPEDAPASAVDETTQHDATSESTTSTASPPAPAPAEPAPAEPVVQPWQPAPSATCAVPPMTELYSGLLPPNPYGDALDASACVDTEHDAIIVLGCPNNDDGTPATCQVKRADIAVSLWQRGYGARFIVTGASVHSPGIEADTLYALLIERGVPQAWIRREPLARHTDENIYYSTRIMEAEGWLSALVVSEDPGHLIMTAVCDSNCCVKLGRLTVVEMDLPATTKVGHYVRYPAGAAVSAAECGTIESPLKFMCSNMDSRLACADRFQLSSPP